MASTSLRQPLRLLADDCHRLAVFVRRPDVARQRDLRCRADDRDRRPQFVRRVRHELTLRIDDGGEPIEQPVERRCERAELVAGMRRRQAANRCALGRDRLCLPRHVAERPQRLRGPPASRRAPAASIATKMPHPSAVRSAASSASSAASGAAIAAT